MDPYNPPNAGPSTNEPERVCPGSALDPSGAETGRLPIDTTVAHPARMYDYFLGGKDNYGSDREAGNAMVDLLPTIPRMARANRAFLGRAVRFLIEQAGVSQFLDIGCGLPTMDPVHEVAQALDPAARVVYVDNDPMVLAHSRALLNGTAVGQVAVIPGDIRNPRALVDHPTVAATLDLTRPVGVMLVSVLMYFTDTEAARLISTVLDVMPPGSYLVISHPTADFDPATVAAAVEVAARAGVTYRTRTRAEVAELLIGLDPVLPGVVPLLSWHTPDPQPDPRLVYYWASVARIPTGHTGEYRPHGLGAATGASASYRAEAHVTDDGSIPRRCGAPNIPLDGRRFAESGTG